MTDRLPVPSHVRWRKASYSNNAAGCIELAALDEAMAVRDSKHSVSPVLTFPTPSFRAFLAAAGENQLG